VLAFYTALTLYTDDYSRTSHTPILQSVRLISNCQDTTATTARLFQDLYAVDRPPPAPNSTPNRQPRPLGRQADHRKQFNKRVEERMEIWTPDLLRQRQDEDHDIKSVIQ